MPDQSDMEQLRRLTETQSSAVLESLTKEQQASLMFHWPSWARPSQVMPSGIWRTWMILAGRGFGKTRTGAETIRLLVNQNAVRHIALVGRSAGDVRDTMIEGESGLLSVYPTSERPSYKPSKRRITFHNGATATTFSADEPDQLRGPNHDLAWADELAAWRYPESWDMLMFGLRIGTNPRAIVTTTPKPTPIIRDLVGITDGSVRITKGSTFENRANLAPSFIEDVVARYEGTRLGQQELYAEILDDVEGALWNRVILESNRVTEHPELTRVVVAVDPAAGSKAENAETGIVVVGYGVDGHAYVLQDDSIRGTPNDWGRAVVAAYHTFEADRIVAEANQGGDMVSHTLRTVDPTVAIKMVHASRGKRTRAEPVAALYEQGRVHHLGFYGELEDQLCGWIPDHAISPDRLDALVWGVTELMLGSGSAPAVVPVSLTGPSQWKL